MLRNKVCSLFIGLSAFNLWLFSPATYKIVGFPDYKVGDLVSSSTLEQFAQVNQIKHWQEIQKLIWCESRWVNIVHMDNGAMSRGILQFRDGIGGKAGFWRDVEQKSGMIGTSTNPYDAVRFTDWALEAGLKKKWTCAKIMKLL